jgi:urea transport system ATP-binding protein
MTETGTEQSGQPGTPVAIEEHPKGDPPWWPDGKPPILEIAGLEVVFDGFRALGGIDLSIADGELRFLIGPNGAGKTTLIDCITGLTKPTAGTVKFAGDVIAGKREYQVVRLGIGRTFQTASVFEDLSVAENIDLAANFRTPLVKLLRRRKGLSEAVSSALEITQLDALADRPAGILSHGQRQWLEIGMLLAQEPRLLLLDEPVAGMSREERDRTGELLREITKDRTVIVIEHDMDFLRRYANDVTVLHEGKVLRTGTVDEVQNDPVVQEVYLGRAERGAGPSEAAAEVPETEDATENADDSVEKK